MSKDSYVLSHKALARDVLVKKMPRARRMTLRVSPTKRDIILSIPKGIGEKRASAFIDQHVDWINQQISALPQPVPFEHGRLVPLQGEWHQLSFPGPRTSKHKGQDVVSQQMFCCEGDEEMVEDEKDRQPVALLQVLGAVEHAPRRLTDWLKKRARLKLAERVDFHAQRLGLSYKRLGVRDQTSRWGSCSSNKTLSFSWRLILAPEQVLDYVAAHEVAHLREMNHSPRFWALVEKTMPDYRQARLWLRENGQTLHCYGASA